MPWVKYLIIHQWKPQWRIFCVPSVCPGSSDCTRWRVCIQERCHLKPTKVKWVLFLMQNPWNWHVEKEKSPPPSGASFQKRRFRLYIVNCFSSESLFQSELFKNSSVCGSSRVFISLFRKELFQLSCFRCRFNALAATNKIFFWDVLG